MKSIKLGVNNKTGETIDFAQLICPKCNNITTWEDVWSEVDCNDTLSSDRGCSGNFTCSHCNANLYVCMDVLVKAEIDIDEIKN